MAIPGILNRQGRHGMGWDTPGSAEQDLESAAPFGGVGVRIPPRAPLRTRLRWVTPTHIERGPFLHTATSARFGRSAALIAAGVILAACGSTGTTVTTSAPAISTAAATIAPQPPPAVSPADLFAALQAAWTAGDAAELAMLVPGSADELLADGAAESVVIVNPADCAPDAAEEGRCELLAVVDGVGLIYHMYFSPAPDGGLTIDRVEFGGDAG